MDKELLLSFKEESQEMLQLLEEYLIVLEKDPYNKKAINGIFRIMHTLKGTSSLIGIDPISRFSHTLETIFEEIREGKRMVKESVITGALKALDIIIDYIDKPNDDFQKKADKIIEDIEKSSVDEYHHLYHLRFNTIEGFDLSELKESFDVEHFSLDESNVPLLDEYRSKEAFTICNIYLWSNNKKSIEDWIIKNKIKSHSLFSIMKHQRKKENLSVSKEESKDSDIKTGQKIDLDTIRIKADKIDKIVDLTGELVVAQGRLAEYSRQFDDSRITTLARDFEMLITSLREIAMNSRMIPINILFKRFKRVVRELSKDLGKNIELEIAGAENELDRSVVEKLYDPLLHIIRNSCDHGIRKNGTIRLEAIHQAADIVIRVSDDGVGIDKDAVYKKACEKGLVSNDAKLSDKEIFELLMLPGFSTSKNVTNISGRGVGMDVVSNSVKSLKGNLTIDSEKDKGTVISISIPLTVAIIEGFLVGIGDRSFVIPLSVVEACVEIDEKDIKKREDWILFRENVLPYVDLKRHLKIEDVSMDEKKGIIVVVNENNNFYGIKVDNVYGIRNTVIKPVGNLNKEVEEISGAALLGDGNIALIIDTKVLHSKLKE